ncbi:hypothetical protein [Streptomyces erythrochromogenes]|uniref:hypothetical protein n=1 Tax=Streptomyces erythrochromogenes TaxID=285574 RepID=UPI003865DE05|nr:hypothetical protein OG364_01785 [Streptomyces erythrochromogenes]
MRITRTLATAGLTLAALGLAGTASIASAAPVSAVTTTAASAPVQGAHTGDQVFASLPANCPKCHP